MDIKQDYGGAVITMAGTMLELGLPDNTKTLTEAMRIAAVREQTKAIREQTEAIKEGVENILRALLGRDYTG